MPSMAARTPLRFEAPHRFTQHAIDTGIIETPQEAVQRGVIGHRRQLQHCAQLTMLAQAHLGFTKGPIFRAHQAKHGQQLRLGELMFAETAAVTRQNRRSAVQGHAGERQESDLGHPTSCPNRKHQPLANGASKSHAYAEDVNRAISDLRFQRTAKRAQLAVRMEGGSGILARYERLIESHRGIE